MSLRKLLDDFTGVINISTTDAPDEYPDCLVLSWEAHMADIENLCSQIYPRLKRDTDKAEILNGQLISMISAFEAGNKKLGRKIAWNIYNSKPDKLR